MQLIHATCVDLGGHALLIRGPSGSGKSDLALRLIDGGAVLVADDQTALRVDGGKLWADAPPTIAGMLEVRGLGIVRLPHHGPVPVALLADLAPPDKIDRLPQAETVDLLGLAVPRLSLTPFQASSAAKVRLAMLSATRDIMVG